MNIYLDSSALATLLIPEAGVEIVRGAWVAASGRFVSLLGYAEIRSAIAAADRSHRLDRRATAAVIEAFETLWDRIAAVHVDEPLVRTAGELADRRHLRAGDAVHLASALRIDRSTSGIGAFVAFDDRLRDAAEAEGLAVLPRRTRG